MAILEIGEQDKNVSYEHEELLCYKFRAKLKGLCGTVTDSVLKVKILLANIFSIKLTYSCVFLCSMLSVSFSGRFW